MLISQHQRGLDDELFDQITIEVAADMQRKLHEHDTRYHAGIQHDVVGKPRRLALGQPAREQRSPIVSQGNNGAQQRVIG